MKPLGEVIGVALALAFVVLASAGCAVLVGIWFGLAIWAAQTVLG